MTDTQKERAYKNVVTLKLQGQKQGSAVAIANTVGEGIEAAKDLLKQLNVPASCKVYCKTSPGFYLGLYVRADVTSDGNGNIEVERR